MSVTLLNIPIEIIKTHLIPFLSNEEKNEPAFNCIITKKARETLAFFRTCKQYYSLRPKYLEFLKEQYLTNLKNREQVIIPKENKEPSLHFLVRTQRFNDFIVVLFGGEDVNKKNHRNVTALQLSSHHKLAEFVDILKKHPQLDIDDRKISNCAD